jgi:hypothetical protein
MLDTGGGGGGTPWESMTLDLMQRLIQNPDVQAHWQLVEAWNKSAQLLGDHLWQMQEYRSNLAAVWPPQKSPAAAAYLDRLDELISNVKETYEASIANHRAFSAVTGSIHQAQAQMRKIYQEYQISRTAQNGSTPTAQVHREQLRLQAVKLLSSVSTDLAVAQSQIVKPAQYKTITERGDATAPVVSARHVAPPIPPIVPRPAVRGASTTASRSTTSVQTPGVDISQPGLILGGTTQPVVPSPTTIGVGPLDPGFPSGTGGPLSNPGLLPPSAVTTPAIGLPAPPSRPGAKPETAAPHGGTTRPGAGIPEGTTRATTPSGFIGGVPAGSSRSSSRPTTSRRINPVGGVIGEGGRALGSRRGVGLGGSSAGEHPGGVYGAGPRRQPAGRQDDDRPRWDPNNPWEIAEGVDPVVLPPRERPIDPGPVIGLG